MKASLLIAGLLGAVVGVAAGIGFIPGVAERLTAPPAPITTGTARVGGPFALQDGQGRTVTDRDFAGTPRLVVFAFTRCGQPCAATLQISTELATRLERVGERIVTLVIGIDPAHDSAGELQRYVATFDPRAVALSGPPESIATVMRQYHVNVGRTADAVTGAPRPADSYGLIYLMGRDGSYAAHFSAATPLGEALGLIAGLPK